MARTRRPWAFGAVSTALMIGHALVVTAALALGAVIAVARSPMGMPLGWWHRFFGISLIVVLCLHFILVLAAPLWSWLAARTQTRVSRLWAWLGYFIPAASLWLPAQTLRALAADADEHLRLLVLGWGLARGMAALIVAAPIVYGLYRLGPTSNVTAGLALAYMFLSVIAANLLSLLMIGRMRLYLATAAVDTRHAEVFA